MKKIIIIVSLCFFTFSCKEKNKPVVDSGSYNLYVVTVDSCEYVVISGYGSGIIHKQNCKNH